MSESNFEGSDDDELQNQVEDLLDDFVSRFSKTETTSLTVEKIESAISKLQKAALQLRGTEGKSCECCFAAR